MKNIKLTEFADITKNESSSLNFLLECKSLMGRSPTSCPACKSKKHYTMAKGRVRCSKCKTDYNPFKDTWIASVSIPYSKWVWLVKLFDLGISARRAARETSTSYPTSLKAFDTIRYSILYQLAKSDKVLNGEIEADEAYFGGKRKGNRGRGARNKTIVFGILERGGKVSVSIVQNVSADTLMNETVKKVRRGSIVYTDKWRGYDSLMFCGYKHLSVDHRYKFKSGKVYINGIEGFWSFAKERLIKHHGISPGKFLLYIKEMEWRYNHKNKEDNIFMMLVEYLLGARY